MGNSSVRGKGKRSRGPLSRRRIEIPTWMSPIKHVYLSRKLREEQRRRHNKNHKKHSDRTVRDSKVSNQVKGERDVPKWTDMGGEV